MPYCLSVALALEAAESDALDEGVGEAFVPLEICARGYLAAGRLILQKGKVRKVRLCLRDQPVIDAVLQELKR